MPYWHLADYFEAQRRRALLERTRINNYLSLFYAACFFRMRICFTIYETTKIRIVNKYGNVKTI